MRTKSEAKKTGEAVRAERIKCGYTPKKLATLTDMSVEMIKDIEAGKTEITTAMLLELATALRSTPDRLAAFHDAPIGIKTRLETIGKDKVLACYLDGWELDTVEYRRSGNVLLTFREKEKC